MKGKVDIIKQLVLEVYWCCLAGNISYFLFEQFVKNFKYSNKQENVFLISLNFILKKI